MKIMTALVLTLLTATSLRSQDLSLAVSRAKPAVIYIAVYTTQNKSSGKTLVKTGYGSGTILSESGYIVTNYHVVNKGEYYQATLSDGTECDFETLENGAFFLSDPESDIAVMKLKSSGEKFCAAKLVDSDSAAEGETVLAIGNPYGLRHSITSGIISSKGRFDLGFTEIEDFIQTDVPINPGNSGGPLVNTNGEMIGLNSAIRTVSGGYQGISFAIPSEMVKKVAYDLLHFGHVRRGWLGIIVRDEKSENSDRHNVRIISLAKNSPALKAGIMKGDIIREVDNELISSKGCLIKIIKNRETGSRIPIVVSRGGRLKEFLVIFEERDFSENKAALEFRRKYGISVESGDEGAPVVSKISQDSPNISADIKCGDTVLSVNGGETPDIDSFMEKINTGAGNAKKLELLRDGGRHSVRIDAEK